MPGCAGNFPWSQLRHPALPGWSPQGTAPLQQSLRGWQVPHPPHPPFLGSWCLVLCDGGGCVIEAGLVFGGLQPGQHLKQKVVPHLAGALTGTSPAWLCMVKQRLNPITWPLGSLPVNWAASHMLLSPFTASTRPCPLRKASCERDLLLF